MSYIKVNAYRSATPVKIYYEDLGHGKPVILIHGWPLDHQMWEFQIPALVQSGHRVIAYDRRGFGKSSRPWDGYDYDTLSEDLKILIEQLDLHDVTLVGFSMGGGEVVRYISRYGIARVSKIVLLGAVTPSLKNTFANPDGVDQKVFDEMLENIQKDRFAFMTEFSKQFFGVTLINKPVSPEMMNHYASITYASSPHAMVECAKAFSQTMFEADVASVNVPTLIIHGESDRTVPIEATGERTAALIPGSRFIRYADAPHGFFYTEREKLNRDLLEFLGEPATADVHSSVKYA
jgi:non-heme chloroperoxidase